MVVLEPLETILQDIAAKARGRRLSLQLTQEGLAKRSGVSYGVIKKFERTGLISLASLLKLALVLDALDDFKQLFRDKLKSDTSLDDLLREEPTPKRGRIK